MPPDIRRHVRYPELLLKLQATVYGLYHMTDPDVFYNREDLWTVATEVGMKAGRRAGRAAHGAELCAHEAARRVRRGVRRDPALHARQPQQHDRLDRRPQRRSQLRHRAGLRLPQDAPRRRAPCRSKRASTRTRNSPASSRCGTSRARTCAAARLLVIPCGKALIYAEPIYLQAQRSPMPELRLVVLALQDKLAYGASFEAAMRALFGGAPSSMSAEPASAEAPSAGQGSAQPSTGPANPTADLNALIDAAARDFNDYQRLTSEGKLGEAGQKLEQLKQKLDELTRRKK